MLLLCLCQRYWKLLRAEILETVTDLARVDAEIAEMSAAGVHP